MKINFKKVLALLSSLFKNRDHLKTYRIKIINFVNLIKKAVDSDIADVIVEATKKDYDDKILLMIREWLPKVLKLLNLTNHDTPNMAIRQAVKNLKNSGKDRKELGETYNEIAAELYSNFSGLPVETSKLEIEKSYKSLENA